jgi:hypothetical protein
VLPLINNVLLAKETPPVGPEYHWIDVPEACKSATVALLQKDCDAVPVGAVGEVNAAVTAVRSADSQPFTL